MGVLERRQVEGMMLNKMHCPNSKCSSVMEKPDVFTEDDPIPRPGKFLYKKGIFDFYFI